MYFLNCQFHWVFPIFNAGYEPVKLMQLVTSKINSVCLDFLNNQKFENMCTELSFKHRVLHPVSAHAIRNGRRKMEDRHVVVQDLNTICYIRVSQEPTLGSDLEFSPALFFQNIPG